MKALRPLLAAAVVLGVAAGPAAAEWPEKPITIIVPWSAGGSTDQVTRVIAGELSDALDQEVVVVNQPGASGSIGTKSALDAAKDGYTWTAGAAQDLGSYGVLGMLETKIDEWHLFLDVANVSVVGVNADAPYQDFGQLLEAMKANPGQVAVATAGIASAGHNTMEAIAGVADISYKNVTYDGGNPAVIATVAGETEVTTQLAVEQAEMIRGGKIRPLAVASDAALELAGFGTIPPITQWLADYNAVPNYFGIWTPKGVPDEVVQKMEAAWSDRIANSQALKDYAANRGAQFAPYSGEDAQKRVFPAIQAFSWLMYDAGKAQVAPDQLGIPRP
ncbi:MAG: Bug family tripartite tricarboxylate transporter substrate binding protein [Alphaproteobacteria bacterium]